MTQRIGGHVLRWIEFALLFVGGPLVFVLDRSWMPWMMPALLLAAAGALGCLLWDRSFDRGNLWRWAGLRREMPVMLGVFAVAAAGMVLLLAGLIGMRSAGWIRMHENVQWFALPRRAPEVWAVIMVGYPLLSVYPQELVYRAFLFHRYRAILPTPASRVLASAVVFGWAHLVFVTSEPVTGLPVALTVAGGVLFAWTYHRTGSLAAAWFEHALYGCCVFTIGLGWLFYGGSVQ